MTSVARYNVHSSTPSYHHPHPPHTMQRPPLRHRISQTNSIPIPPSLIDSPYIQCQSSNNPFVAPATSRNVAQQQQQQKPRPAVSNTPQLNLLDTVPMGASREAYEEATATYRKQLSQGTLGLPLPPTPTPASSTSTSSRRGSNTGLVELQEQHQAQMQAGSRPPYTRESSWHRYLSSSQQQQQQQQQYPQSQSQSQQQQRTPRQPSSQSPHKAVPQAQT